MGKGRSCSKSHLLAVFLFLLSLWVLEGKQRAVRIPDELDDVVDDEEDEAWKEWGQKKKKSSVDELPPPDFTKINPLEFQAEMMKRHEGPSLGFVKLRLGVSRSKDDIPMIAMKWSKVLRTGSIEAKFMAVDFSTIMFTMEKGQDIEELKEFVLSQPEAYEMKIGDQVYRRPGDPPLDEVIEMLHRKRSADESHDAATEIQHSKDEL